MNFKNVFGAGIVAGALALSSAAGAAVTYDPDTGGFAGKGDVQLALNLNNAGLQAVADSLSFTYEDEVEYDVPCTKEAGRQVLRSTFARTRVVSATVAYDVRRSNQVTGFFLDGVGGSAGGGSISCPGGWEADGDPVEVGSSGGGLRVNGVLLP